MRESKPGRARVGLYALAPLGIDIAVSLAVLHVFRTQGYSALGPIRNILFWALGLAIASQLLIFTPKIQFAWKRRFLSTCCLDAITSLLPFILIRCLRIPAPDA